MSIYNVNVKNNEKNFQKVWIKFPMINYSDIMNDSTSIYLYVLQAFPNITIDWIKK